ncbi:hypothetical protein ACRYCC_22075 [Actinomadura scrupuli]|uniref:hypothetical protein n=1 Tax=Actinomadura scrupuli TaxID=559629 RepID=UPI003D99E254
MTRHLSDREHRTRWRGPGGRTTSRRTGALGFSVAMTAVLALSACAGPAGGTGAAAGGGSPSAPPSTPEAYRKALSAAVKPLDAALAAFEKAAAYGVLTDRMTTAEQAAPRTLSELRGMTPPTAVGTEHVALVTAVGRLVDDLHYLGQTVSGRRLCTASAVRAQLSRAAGAAAVRDAVKALAAKEPPGAIRLSVPAAGRALGRRPPNGSRVRPGDRSGLSELSVDNDGSADAVITLAIGRRPLYSVYVRKGGKYAVPRVKDGTYTVFYSTGSGWDAAAKAFSTGCEFQRFEKPLTFGTARTATGTGYSRWKIILQPVDGGNARTEPVGPGDFPTG